MKPSRFRSNGREAFCGSSFRSAERGEQIEAGDAERMDHAVRTAGEHHVGLAAADHLGRLADRLAAGGTGGEAIHVRALGVELRRQIRGRHVRLLLELELRIEPLKPFADERAQVELAVLQRGDHHPAEVRKILLPFARAEIDAEPLRLDARRARPTRRSPAWQRRRRISCVARASPRCRVLETDLGHRPIADLGRDLRRKVAGVEERRAADARLAFLQIRPQLGHRRPKRRHAAHAGYYNASSHIISPFLVYGIRRSASKP